MRILMATCFLGLGSVVQAQAPTAAELLAQIDERAAAEDPYAALLLDPDPVRQIAAVELMIETKDPKLVAMAANAGFQSTDPSVRQHTLQAFMQTEPGISLTVDGTGVDQNNYFVIFRNADAAVTPEGIATITYVVGAFDGERRCYLHRPPSEDYCMVTISNGGIRIQSPRSYFVFQGKLGDGGVVSGTTAVKSTKGGFPTNAQLIP